MAKVDKVTKRWIRNESDEIAVSNGCRMDEARGQFVIDWAKENCVLWEGDAAGQPLIAVDWQYDCAMRLFGWVKPSEKYKRLIRRFREALIGKPKKNKKSPTVAWWMLYLLDGDGEPGQNCYTAAKNGQQAKIVQNHAVNMVRSSPTLSQYMKINKSTLGISVEETMSSMKLLSSENIQSQKAQEGLNGSCGIDEIHVVDADFVKRIARMGISRAEPLMLQVTTAGDDPLSYGKQRYDYGKRVESGEFKNDAFFFDWHEAPQDLDPKELSEDPVKFGKMANPSWGHTVGEEEYLADYNGCDTPSSVRDFMMYRLNIWQQTANPFIKASDWEDCEKQVPWEVLESLPCWGGLDFSRTTDLTSLCLIFQDTEEMLHFRWWFWTPEETAKQRVNLAPWFDWEKDTRANLKICPESWIDYNEFFTTLQEIQGRFQVQRLLYDPRFADFPMQRLITGEQNSDGTTKFQPATFEVRPLNQGPVTMTEPIEELERLIVSGRMAHDGNPIAKWQAGHVTRGRNGLLAKPGGQHDARTIDGIQAACIALAGVETGQFSTAYNDSGSGVILF
jgi:phage terminase large subunit-like protein